MSDFTDAEDRQLVQLALMFSRNGRQILWGHLTQQMTRSKKPKEALRQRLKTLKRTYGRNLEGFPAWFFRQTVTTVTNLPPLHAPRHMNPDLKTAIREREKLMVLEVKIRRKLRGNNTKTDGRLKSNGAPMNSPTKPDKSPNFKISPCFPQFAWATEFEPPSSLLLLASVATTPGQGKQFVDSRSA